MGWYSETLAKNSGFLEFKSAEGDKKVKVTETTAREGRPMIKAPDLKSVGLVDGSKLLGKYCGGIFFGLIDPMFERW